MEMEFDERRIDLVKSSIENVDSGQKIISKALDNKLHVNWPKDDEYLGNESILDHLTCDNANWTYEEIEQVTIERDKHVLKRITKEEDAIPETEKVTIVKLKVNTRKDEESLVELAKNHPEPHVRIAAIKKIENGLVLSSIITDDEEEKSVKKASLDRLNELYIE